MAAAARSGVPEARVPCALCGGLIHPLAGKCKHCKANLASYQAARPAASMPLPSLRAATAPPNGQVHWVGKPSSPSPAAGGHAPAPMALLAAQPGTYAGGQPGAHAGRPGYDPTPVAAWRDAAQPVLPPRPTSRALAVEPESRGWRSWPVIVIAVAMVAIVAAVILMVWPEPGHGDAGKRTGSAGPAPERMDTAPEVTTPPAQRQAPPDRTSPSATPPPSGQDPWADPVPPTAPAQPSVAPRDPLSADDIDITADPSAPAAPAQAAPGSRRKLNLNGNGLIMMAMAEHLCRKILQCGTDDPGAKAMCDALASQAPPPPAHCPAAARCLRHIDTMSCGTQSDLSQIATLLGQIADCGEAARC